VQHQQVRPFISIRWVLIATNLVTVQQHAWDVIERTQWPSDAWQSAMQSLAPSEYIGLQSKNEPHNWHLFRMGKYVSVVELVAASVDGVKLS